ncbi:restriction endonuclease subunit S [Campylobacter devanensis]|uniref:restriction endonuclease subunit S n=1 Tax=Campylobacter devanensis TaxID=3161138 RepID=UPI000A35272D|nr:restriction endonuclease subunit S [Campylobacter sp. P157]
MSKLEELINKLCPNGVEFKTLGELGKFYGGLTGKSKEDFNKGNAKFITYKNVYENLSLKIDVEDRVNIGENEKQRTLEYGDIIFTGSSETSDECGISSVLTQKTEEKLYLNSFCFFLRLNDKNLLNPDFTKHLFRSSNLRYQIGKTASGVTRFNVSKKAMEKVCIPVPPLEVQCEIVRILDNFTLLSAELSARQKQYEYYSKELFNFNDDVEFISLESIADIGTGSSNTNEAVEDGQYPFYVRSQQVYYKNNYEYDDNSIITSGDGVGVGKIFHYTDGKYALHQRAYRINITNNKVNSKYFYYYMKSTFYDYIQKNAFNSSVTSIRRPMLNKYPVPILSLEKQNKIVNILEKFEKLCNDLSEGLPAEIEARKKQYEYYRDKLLTFKELKAN